MSTLVFLNNESQERQLGVIQPEDKPAFDETCERERCPAAVIGEFTGDGRLVVHDSNDNTTPVDLPLDGIFAKRPQKVFQLQSIGPVRNPLKLPSALSLQQVLDRLLRHPTVACKGWLTNHVDRSVSGRIAQQSCIGPYQLPIADYSVTATSLLDSIGTVVATGVQPHTGLVSPGAMARITLAEALLNMSGAVISDLADVKCEVNWFSASRLPGEGAVIDETARKLAEAEIAICMAQLGGKDSSSLHNLAINPAGEMVDVKAPVTLVITAAAQMPDITCKVTPLTEGDTLVHVDLSPERKPLGATILAQVYGQTGNDCADVDVSRLIACFHTTQSLIRKGLIKSLHDISDGGLVTTLLEMAFVSGVGLNIRTSGRFGWLKHYFSQVPGVVICCKSSDAIRIMREYERAGVSARVIGQSRKTNSRIRIHHNLHPLMDESMLQLRQVWMETSFRLDQIEADPECIVQERQAMARLLTPPPLRLSFAPSKKPVDIRFRDRPKAAILRAPGSNGDRELAGLAFVGGFQPVDIITTDLMGGRAGLDDCQAAFQSGGFSYMDEPLEAGVGWATSVRENPLARKQYQNFFFERQDTLSYHPCNGAQVATLLGIVPDQTLPTHRRPRFLRNKSGTFESRFVTVRLLPSPAVMFEGMEDSILGILVAHKEGRLFCPDPSVLDWIIDNDLAPMRYVDPNGKIAETYPFNPNDSPVGVAGLCTPDGRHVATMPHIERLFEKWQWPWMPKSWRSLKASPWLRAIQNMFKWCMEHR
jgi:phosphoribosylformylglycinamidine synthase